MKRRPYMIMILDGFGLNDSTVGNAIKAAKTPTFDRLFADYPHVPIAAHGTEVGIDPGLMGNSEVGHMNIGAGRVLKQDILRIGEALEDGSFFKNDAFLQAIEHIKKTKGRLHLYGLLSDGGVHSSDRHYEALVDFAHAHGLKGDQLCFSRILGWPRHAAALGGSIPRIPGKETREDRHRRDLYRRRTLLGYGPR